MVTQQTESMKLTTGNVRFSYCNLTQPRSTLGSDPKYSVTLLIPKSDMATKAKIDVAIAAAMQAGVSSKWGGRKPPHVPTPLHDGDGLRPSGDPFGAECRGHWVVTASSKNKVWVGDVNKQEILNAAEIYSGMYGRASINFFPYDTGVKKGIGCGLNGVQKLQDGEPLGHKFDPDYDFAEAPPAQPAYQQQQPVYQQPAYQHAAVPPAHYAPAAAYVPQPTMAAHNVDPLTGQPAVGSIYGLS